MTNPIIVVAYAVHPDQKSSEAIVNKNWLDISTTKGNTLLVLSAFHNYRFKGEEIQLVKKLNTSAVFYKISKKKKGIDKLLYSIVNKIFKIVFGSNQTLQNTVWINKQSRILEKIITTDDVVWSRVLPTLSLAPVLNVYDKNPFPFVVNVNDPINVNTFNKNNLNSEQKLFLETKNKAQAWTFPSSKLADRMANNYNLDRARCFVIPHAMREVVKLYTRDIIKQRINILYAGTFYKSAFTDELKNSLIAFNKLDCAKGVNFTFVLSQFDDESVTWLKESIPNCTLKFKLEREEVLELLKKADCMFVVDSILHSELLKGKLIEALSFGVPVFAVTYQDSIMDKVVKTYGSISAYQDIEDDILNKMKLFVSNINNKEWLSTFYNQRTNALGKISENYIADATNLVTTFAYQRFYKEQQETIQAPKQLNWP
ncbi:hypothetical protein [Psychroserpens sp. NJDZ02]|uniref:hypothetical protein n=1 Tax=Psychroserpens sp. NJDZ02 TaxID=2570561 RepID=UPI0010A815F9|nr:hypothetical protein [Psychroserpens sp. NJDZ02]QCE40111.1 hypothetical protein E9099_01295 [Psychroserpens sp. NJDZ02]